MKKTIQLLFVFALLLFVTPQINAQDLYNGSGNRIGKIDSDGTVRNSSGNGVGKINSDGTVRGSAGNSIGKIESDGSVRNSSGNK